MADAVVTQILEDGPKWLVVKCTNISDGTGESAVTKVDPATTSGNPNRFVIDRIQYSTFGMGVNIFFDGAVDIPAWTISSDMSDDQSFRMYGGLTIPASISASTGQIQFTTVGHTSGDTYSIILTLRKKY